MWCNPVGCRYYGVLWYYSIVRYTAESGNARQYEYHILKITEDELRLCAPEPGAGAWGTAWFWNFKKK